MYVLITKHLNIVAQTLSDTDIVEILYSFRTHTHFLREKRYVICAWML